MAKTRVEILMSKVLVTGGSGFIGCNLIEYLVKKGYEVLNLDVNVPRNLKLEVYWKKCSLLDLNSLREYSISFDPAYVIHLGARTDLKGESIDAYEANTGGTRNLIEVLSLLPNLINVLFSSSRLVCKIGHNPLSDDEYSATTSYGLSKVVMEKDIRRLCSDVSFEWLIFRPTSIWGPWFGEPYKDFFDVVTSGKYFHPYGRKIVKSFGYVGNAVYLLEKIISSQSPLDKSTIYLTDFESLDILDWSNLIRHKLGRRSVFQAPLFLLRLVAYFGSFLEWLGFKSVPLTRFRLDNLLTNMEFNTHPVRQFSDRLPFTLEDGVDETLFWIKNQK